MGAEESWRSPESVDVEEGQLMFHPVQACARTYEIWLVKKGGSKTGDLLLKFAAFKFTCKRSNLLVFGNRGFTIDFKLVSTDKMKMKRIKDKKETEKTTKKR